MRNAVSLNRILFRTFYLFCTLQQSVRHGQGELGCPRGAPGKKLADRRAGGRGSRVGGCTPPTSGWQGVSHIRFWSQLSSAAKKQLSAHIVALNGAL